MKQKLMDTPFASILVAKLKKDRLDALLRFYQAPDGHIIYVGHWADWIESAANVHQDMDEGLRELLIRGKQSNVWHIYPGQKRQVVKLRKTYCAWQL
jgi:hypothetical protein